MKTKSLLFNARIYTQADDIVVNSMAIVKNRIVAVGNNLQHDPDFSSYQKIDLKGKTIIPGLVDAHTHFYYFALSFGRVSLDGLPTIEACLKKISEFSKTLGKKTWVVGDGYAPDRFTRRVEPDRYMLDKVTDGRPAFFFSKDQHSAWVNSKALEHVGMSKTSPDPERGKIERFPDGTPTGILRESQAYQIIWNQIPSPPKSEIAKLYAKALDYAYRKGVTGVHSFDGPEGFQFFLEQSQKNKLGIRINYYTPGKLLECLDATKTFYGSGNEFLRIAGVKLFADGSLGSQTALCFNKYDGSKNNFGLEVTTVDDMKNTIRAASRLGFPCAIHAIGDKAVSNVLDAFESSPKMHFGARYRIEHLQLLRKSDIARVKRLNVVASMQPSHCPSDIPLIKKYWGKRGANAFVFRTLIDKGIDLAFGSDAPIEPLDPIAGIAAAVRRARPGSNDVFNPKQKISASEALFRFTVGPAIACGQEHCRGYLLPGYPADFAILDRDIIKIPASKLYDTKVLATILDGQVKYAGKGISL